MRWFEARDGCSFGFLHQPPSKDIACANRLTNVTDPCFSRLRKKRVTAFWPTRRLDSLFEGSDLFAEPHFDWIDVFLWFDSSGAVFSFMLS